MSALDRFMSMENDSKKEFHTNWETNINEFDIQLHLGTHVSHENV